MGRFQAASVGARVARLFVSVRNIKLSGRDGGRSTDLDKHEGAKQKERKEEAGEEAKMAEKRKWTIC